jgi:hypothetical protein
VARWTFWGSVGLLVWVHLVFPGLVLLRARLRPRPVAEAPITPSLSIVVAAHNEAAHIGPRIANVLAQAYPADCLEVIVASDGSTDATNALVAAAANADGRVQLLALGRVGKIAALDAAVARAKGEILVFTDANTELAPGALAAIVRPFADPEVGGVAGDQRSRHHGDGAGERAYWSLDRVLKVAESRAGSTISATGALYAIRRSLYEPPPPGVTDDFAISTGVVAAGRRLVFSDAAVAIEPVAPGGRRDYRRKVRIITQGLEGVRLRRALLDPRRTGFYAVQLATHKVLRRLGVVPLLGIAASTPFLVGRGPLYALALLAQLAVYGLGAAGLTLRGKVARLPILSLPAFFCLVQAAALHALVNVIRGRHIERWQTERDVAETAG